ncbi:Alkane hydroxylase MAH1-like protein [Drosera capensis]
MISNLFFHLSFDPMANLGIIVLALAAIVSLIALVRRLCDRSGLPTNYPIFGMLPSVLKNLQRSHYFATEILQKCNCNFLFYGPWFTKMSSLSTADPANIHYIMSKNFPNYPKGPEFKQMFDLLGDGIFNADSELWKVQRKLTHAFMSHPKFYNLLVKTISTKVAKVLQPILDRSCKEGTAVDLQDLLRRLTFDSICILITGRDPMCLAADLPEVPFAKSMNDMQETIAFRHVVPVTVWKLCRVLGIWKEKQMLKAGEILDSFLYEVIATKRAEIVKRRIGAPSELVDAGVNTEVDLLTSCMLEFDQSHQYGNHKFLRDMVLSLLLAGMDTTSTALSWFFWLLSTNPKIEWKVRKEVEDVAPSSQLLLSSNTVMKEKLSKLVYLQAALSETMRLYPPVPYEFKSPLEPDVLPSGHRVDSNMRIMVYMYAMGRMKSTWGEDCDEFKPERWITEQGKLKHEPSYKFLAFNAGPRTCLGKEMAFIQMKVIVSSLITKYRFEVVGGHPVELEHMSVILHMKHGLKVRVVKIHD